MKKIIALAVAGAFVPAINAAEITVGGSIEFQVTDNATTSTAKNDSYDPMITIGATSETNAGYTVSGNIDYDTNGTAVDDANISIAGDFGKVTVGSPSGGLDAYGDYTDISPEKGGFRGDGTDQFIAFSPALGGPVSVTVSVTPADYSSNGASNEGSAIGIEYSGGAFTAYAGTESYKSSSTSANDLDVEVTSYGVKTTIGGVMIAAEAGTLSNEGAAAQDSDFSGFAVKYSMGDITFGYESQSIDTAYTKGVAGSTASSTTVAKADEDIAFISYNFGGGLSAYVEGYDESEGDTEQTTVGLKYSF